MDAMFTILHLSDLQSGNKHSWWAPRPGDHTSPTYGRKIHRQIVDALKTEMYAGKAASAIQSTEKSSFQVDLILVTGDIAEQAEVNEYDPPVEFLTLLHKELRETFLFSPEICIIPGNHDVNRAACEKAKDKSAAEQFKAKFDAYNAFAGRFGDNLRVRFEQPFVFKRLSRRKEQQEFRLELIGLNSCMQESHREEDHYGYVGGQQLQQLRTFLKGKKFLPYSIRVAAFHHNPLLQGQATAEAIEALYASDLAGIGRSRAINLRNYLHDSRSLLTQLAEHGFQVALHGHQHVDDVFTIGLPARRHGEPFARSTIVTLGAGSAGLRHGTTPQPSVASALLLRFEPIPWGWNLETRRITFAVHGSIHPQVNVEIGDTETLILPRGQPLEAITVVANTLSPPNELICPGFTIESIDPAISIDQAIMNCTQQTMDKDGILRDGSNPLPDVELDEFQLWSTPSRPTSRKQLVDAVTQLETTDLGLVAGTVSQYEALMNALEDNNKTPLRFFRIASKALKELQNSLEQEKNLILPSKYWTKPEERKSLEADLRTILPLGLRSWAKGYFYRDESMLALRGLELPKSGDDTPKIALYIERFSKSAIFNWNLRANVLTPPTDKGKYDSFWNKWIKRHLHAPNELVEKFPFLSWRCAITIIATVRHQNDKGPDDKGPEQWRMVVRKRTDNESSDPDFDSVTHFVRAACRPSSCKDDDIGKLVGDAPTVLKNAVCKALERETGCDRCDFLLNKMELIALYLDPLEINPVWLYWLDMDEATFAQFKANSVHRIKESVEANDVQSSDDSKSDWEYVPIPMTVESFNVPRKDSKNFMTQGNVEKLKDDIKSGAARMSDDTRLALRLWLGTQDKWRQQ